MKRARRLYKAIKGIVVGAVTSHARTRPLRKTCRGRITRLEETADRTGVSVQRYPGRDEPRSAVGDDDGPRTTGDAAVTAEDAMVADDIFRTLMGDEVAPRRDFIRTHALEVKNLDV